MSAILVPSGYGEAELIEKRSRFTGRVWPVESEQEALAHINEMREKYWDATHNVYAYIIREGGLTRYSDDGEPHGTSGMPTLEVFRAGGVCNVCCVVTRYFGGVLLGTGGLVRAYTAAAKAALENAGISELKTWNEIVFDCPYSLYEQVRREAEMQGGRIESADFLQQVRMTALFPDEGAPAFLERLTALSAGKIRAEAGEKRLIAVPASQS